jgi:hypothetical protein
MNARMDNLQAVFDRTDWNAFQSHKADLAAAVDCRPRSLDGLQELLYWLEVVQAAARLDGYQVDLNAKDNAQ